MPVEIERKFLVAGDAWRAAAHRRERLIDGLVVAAGGKKVRARIYENRATLTIKGERVGFTRAEFEYEIPAAEALELIRDHCGERVVVKTRHYVRHEGHEWQVDEYEGLLAGVVIAEIELDDAGEYVPLPLWIGAEVTDDPAYRKINLLNERLAGLVRPVRHDGWGGPEG